MFGMPSIKREGQTMLNMCMEQCEGVYLMDEIKRLREENESLWLSNNMLQDILEMKASARAALKGDE